MKSGESAVQFLLWQRRYDVQSADGGVFTALAAFDFIDLCSRDRGAYGMGSILFDSRAERGFPFSAGRSTRACVGGVGNSQLGPGWSPDQLCCRHGILRGALLVRLGAPRLLPLRGFLS